MRSENSEARNRNYTMRKGKSKIGNWSFEMRNGKQENLYPISQMTYVKWVGSLKREFPILEYPSQREVF